VAVKQPPPALLGAVDARHSEGDRPDLVAPRDLRLEPLDLERVSQISDQDLREVLERERAAVTVVRRGEASGLLDL